MSRLRKSGLAVRSPMTEDGVPAIDAAPEVWAVIEKAAIAAVATELPQSVVAFGDDGDAARH